MAFRCVPKSRGKSKRRSTACTIRISLICTAPRHAVGGSAGSGAFTFRVQHTMSAFTLIALLSLLPSVIQALRCHQIASANLSNPPETQATDCIAGSLACTKLVDYTMKTFSKQCQQFNCTSGSLMNAPASCTNTSQLGRDSLSCCCYGDGCNTAPVSSLWLTFSAVAVLAIGKAVFA